ncbi:uncharacterized protein LOC133728955 isoform X4 [Rosa rugosa]|uniref:uncharacterized protein LOC133728955 isoform X4 n=1 Tax=Rosa rugosa TaxID=74645 RepID=UPI002B4124CC|nr:uncharacterized protein LOC133728955 isoform X4 [Rosa rugosa]
MSAGSVPSLSLSFLKKLVLQRAGVIGHEELAVKFDLKVLRALGFEDSAAFMESCNLLKCDLGDVMSLEEIKACIGIHLRKAASKRFCNSIALNETTLSQKKQKFGTSGV